MHKPTNKEGTINAKNISRNKSHARTKNYGPHVIHHCQLYHLTADGIGTRTETEESHSLSTIQLCRATIVSALDILEIPLCLCANNGTHTVTIMYKANSHKGQGV